MVYDRGSIAGDLRQRMKFSLSVRLLVVAPFLGVLLVDSYKKYPFPAPVPSTSRRVSGPIFRSYTFQSMVVIRRHCLLHETRSSVPLLQLPLALLLLILLLLLLLRMVMMDLIGGSVVSMRHCGSQQSSV